MGSVRSLGATSALAFAALALSATSCRAPAAAPSAEPGVDAREAHLTSGETRERDAGERPHVAQNAHKYSVPFAAELDREDPLAQTRAYFQQLFGDNAAFMRTHDAAFFRQFASTQKPRATVVTCSDSRVQSSAFDATPENDDFFVRNIGNQIANSVGSVEYGVHHLKTPVLLVLGHTGCGAVKAAMGDTSTESAAIRKELDALKTKKSPKADDPGVWADAVIENVHDQVAVALDTFGEAVQSGELTIVGAVYDFRNDLRQGIGKVVVVDVNGRRDAAKLAAFERGVLGAAAPDPHGADAGAPHRGAPSAKDVTEPRR